MTPPSNLEQRRYWNEEGGEAWVTTQKGMDAMLAPIADVVAEAAGLRSGERVVDIGCGCGATTLRFAESVGMAGAAVGVDISLPMIEHARSRAAAAGLNNATFVIADAQSDDVPGEFFDVVASRFGVMFFAEPTVAFSNIRQWAAPGGRLTFACWRSAVDNEWASAPGGVLRSILPPGPAPDPLAPGPFAFADRGRVKTILDDSGWSDIDIVGVDRDITQFAGASLDDAVDRTTRLGPAARLLSGVDDDVRAEAVAAMRAYFAERLTPNGIVSNGAIWLVSARNS